MTVGEMIRKLRERWNVIQITIERTPCFVTLDLSDALTGPFKRVIGATIYHCLKSAIKEHCK